jgi:catechol 2,3-dioxygenase-like lactoylglutathione lyase family enzyme
MRGDPMTNAIRVRMVAVGMRSRVLWIRTVHLLRNLGRPRVRRIDHVTVPVRDLDEARRFYCEVLGGAFLMKVDNEFFQKVGRPTVDPSTQGAFHISVLLGGATRVDLFLQDFGQAAPAQPHPHHAFAVSARDLPKWKARLEALGTPTDGPLRLGPPGQASLYFNDPFGNHLELTCVGYAREIPVRPPELSKIVWRTKEAAAR